MRYTAVQVTFQEIPNEISLSLLISGCPLRCPGCHSSDSWNSNKGVVLNEQVLLELIEPYQEFLTCICFLGGEWQRNELAVLCQFARARGLKVALYTGLDDVDAELRNHLDYLKVGSYQSELGGLGATTTNQKLINLNAHGGRNGQT